MFANRWVSLGSLKIIENVENWFLVDTSSLKIQINHDESPSSVFVVYECVRIHRKFWYFHLSTAKLWLLLILWWISGVRIYFCWKLNIFFSLWFCIRNRKLASSLSVLFQTPQFLTTKLNPTTPSTSTHSPLFVVIVCFSLALPI